MIQETAFAKINLSLYIKNRREDGYHNLETIFCTISLHDTLSFAPEPSGKILLAVTGLKVPTTADNLVIKAARALHEYTGTTQGAVITLVKRVPLQAGLGRGSADAAATLRGLNRLWQLRLTERELERLALQLGSDVPFALKRGVYLGRGRGERLSPLLEIQGWFLLFIPSKRVPTPWAFKNYRNYLTEKQPIVNLKRLFPQVREGKQSWNRLFYNSFEALNRSEIPAVGLFAKAVEPFQPAGKAVSGSGSAYFAYFQNREKAELACRRLKGKFKPLWLVTPVPR